LIMNFEQSLHHRLCRLVDLFLDSP
jgi:hypothetical protein